MKFTIGIPAFKSVFIKDCISSILNQTYENFELIIINDASPYPIDEIISYFNDSRIKYFKNEKNTGANNVVNNWNKCLALAAGDYFVLMGDDDKLEPHYLYEFSLLIIKYPSLDVFHCRSKIINGESNVVELTPSWPDYETIYDNIWHRIKGFRMQYISDFIYKTDSLKENGGFYFLPLAWGSDDITAYRQMKKKGIAHTNRCLLNYRNSPVTISNSGNNSLKLLAIEEEKKWLDEFVNSQSPTGDDLVILQQIKKILPQYFLKKRKITLSQEYGKGILKGFTLSFNEIKNNRLTFNESLSVFVRVIKLFFFNIIRKPRQ
jgi:glycosyltransferase involved in cell wall biosynthesis